MQLGSCELFTATCRNQYFILTKSAYLDSGFAKEAHLVAPIFEIEHEPETLGGKDNLDARFGSYQF